MAEEFGTPADQDGQNTGQDFNQQPSDKDGSTGQVDITPEQLEELRKRDAHAQEHIQRLESDNATLRDDKTSLANEVASLKTVEEVMQRIDDGKNQGSSDPLDLSKVDEIVSQKLEQKATEQTQQQNWSEVLDRIESVYGDFDSGNVAIQARAAELKMTTQEATGLAKTNPTLFYELFVPSQGSAPQQSAASASTLRTDVGQSHSNNSGTRDKAYYNKMLKEDKKKYFSVDNQAQMRRDLYPE